MTSQSTSRSFGQAQIQNPSPHTHDATLFQTRKHDNALTDLRLGGGPEGKQKLPEAKPWAHFVAGAWVPPRLIDCIRALLIRFSIGGMTSATLTSPLDVLKTRFQSDYYRSQIVASRRAKGTPSPNALSAPRAALLHFQETFQILFSVHRIEGWRALFKGLGPQLIGVVPARAINFFTYGNGKKMVRDKFNDGRDAAWVNLIAAVNAGVITGTATNPIWLVKTRVQLDKNVAEMSGIPANRQYKNSIDCIRQTFRTEGIKGFYRGLTASYLGVAESTLQWVLYEQMKMSLKNREIKLAASGKKPTAWDNVVLWTGKIGAAGTAKFFAALITYPHEVIRTRLRQAPMADGRLKYTGILQCFRLMWKEEGMASLYGGLTPHMLRVVPSACIMFGT